MKQFKADPHNANKGTATGKEMLEKSLAEYGAGRSVLSDKHGVIMAGNKTLEVAQQRGMKIREVETAGDELIVVVRTDLDLQTDAKARELAYADNRVGQVNLEWDTAVMTEDIQAGSIDLSKFWSQDAIAALLRAAAPNSDANGGGDASLSNKFCIVIECEDEEKQRELIKEFIDRGIECRALVS